MILFYCRCLWSPLPMVRSKANYTLEHEILFNFLTKGEILNSKLPGEKFEGGYHIERNPITGAARLVHPPSPSKGKSCRFSSWLHHRFSSDSKPMTCPLHKFWSFVPNALFHSPLNWNQQREILSIINFQDHLKLAVFRFDGGRT